MKFGKKLRSQVSFTIPEWRDKFVNYKGLKRCLRMYTSHPQVTAVFGIFLALELEKINNFFQDKEEEFVMRLQKLKDERDELQTSVGLLPAQTLRDGVNLYGEMILLENYSGLNFMAFTKIVKKYDKVTRQQNCPWYTHYLLQQSFFNTEILSDLERDCTANLLPALPVSRSIQSIRSAQFIDRALSGLTNSRFNNVLIEDLLDTMIEEGGDSSICRSILNALFDVRRAPR